MAFPACAASHSAKSLHRFQRGVCKIAFTFVSHSARSRHPATLSDHRPCSPTSSPLFIRLEAKVFAAMPDPRDEDGPARNLVIAEDDPSHLARPARFEFLADPRMVNQPIRRGRAAERDAPPPRARQHLATSPDDATASQFTRVGEDQLSASALLVRPDIVARCRRLSL